jgi:DNA-binding response OmpR family regulator
LNATPLLHVSVLVVEDHDDTRELEVFALLDAGALVEGVASVADALRLIAVAVPDVVVIDLDLPDEDGYTLLRNIRQLAAAKRVGTIAATAYAQERDRSRALTAGFDVFLTKPFAPDLLVATVTALAARLAGEDG